MRVRDERSKSWEATAGENGEKSGLGGDVECAIGDRGGVAEKAGDPYPDEPGDRAGEELRGDCWPLAGLEGPGEPAEDGLFSTSRSKDERNVAPSCAAPRWAAA